MTRDAVATGSGSGALGVLRDHWGYAAFRGPQSAAIDAVVSGDDVLVVMATGGGKSLVMQVPALVLGRPGFVVSPLISLMEDQVQALRARGVRACLLGSAQHDARVKADAWAGRYQIVYLTPELAMASADRLAALHASVGVSLLAVDEAHCISEWGHDYRAEYLRLGELRDALPGVPFVAVTATATPRVRREIRRKLRFRTREGRAREWCTSFERPNLRFEVAQLPPAPRGPPTGATATAAGARTKALAAAIGALCRRSGPTIVYTLTTRRADELAAALQSHRQLRVAAYHARLPPACRSKVHTAFIADELDIVVATVAYGMGIDKPNVRAVVHAGTPASPEAYFQQAGRAGRDGAPAVCRLYWSPGDVATSDLVRGGAGSEAVRDATGRGTTAMQAYIATTACRAAALVNHFVGPGDGNGNGDGAPTGAMPKHGPCTGTCDNCDRVASDAAASGSGSGSGSRSRDVGVEAVLLLTAVRCLDGRFGVGKALALLRGTGAGTGAVKGKGKASSAIPQALERRGAAVIGKGATRSEVWWRGLLGVLVAEGFVEYRTVQAGQRSFSAPFVTQHGSSHLLQAQAQQALDSKTTAAAGAAASADGLWLKLPDHMLNAANAPWVRPMQSPSAAATATAADAAPGRRDAEVELLSKELDAARGQGQVSDLALRRLALVRCTSSGAPVGSLMSTLERVVRRFVDAPGRTLRAAEHVLSHEVQGAPGLSPTHLADALPQDEPKDSALGMLELFARGPGSSDPDGLDAEGVAALRGVKRATVLCQLARCAAHGWLRPCDAARLQADAFPAQVFGDSSDLVVRCIDSALRDAELAGRRLPVSQLLQQVRSALASSEDDRVMAAAAAVDYTHLHVVAGLSLASRTHDARAAALEIAQAHA